MTSYKKYAEEFFESVEKLYVAIPGVEDGFGKDFLQIKKKADELKQDPAYSCKTGQADENRKKNRYKDILPFDFARVKFNNYHGGTDYINASYIKRGKDEQCYIAAQGPLPHTVNDFWNMIWCCQVKVIVMVCKEIEMGRRKCERYWADDEERCKTFGEFTIDFGSSRQDNKDFLVRTLVVKFRNERRTVIQYHYTAWPDHGVPKARASILQMIMEARRDQSYESDTKQPLCIHCSAGCGRTGAVLVIDYFRYLLSIDRLEGKVFNVVMDMRRQRSSIVQTKEQYEFVHLAVGELLTNHFKDKQVNCPENSVSRSIAGAHNYVNVQIQPDRKHTSLAPMKSTPTPEVKPRSSQPHQYFKSPSDVPPGKPSRNPADARTAPGSRVTSFDSADGKSRPAIYSKPQNKIPPPKPSLVKRASSDSGPIPGTPAMVQQKSSTFGYLNRGAYPKAGEKYGKDPNVGSSQAAASKPPTGKVQLPALQEKFNLQTQQQNMDKSHHHHHHRFVSASVLDLSDKSSQKQQQQQQHQQHNQQTGRMVSASVQDLRSVDSGASPSSSHHPKATERNGSPFQQATASALSSSPKATVKEGGFVGSFKNGSKAGSKSSGQSYTNGSYAAVTIKSSPPAVKPKPKPTVRRKPTTAGASPSSKKPNDENKGATTGPSSVQQQVKALRFVNNLPAIRKQQLKTTTPAVDSSKEVKQRAALPRSNHHHHPNSDTAVLRRALKPETATPVTLSPPTPARRTHITSPGGPKAPVRYPTMVEVPPPPATQPRPVSQLYPSSSSSKPLTSSSRDVSSKRDSTCSSVVDKTVPPTTKKPQPIKPKRSIKAATSTAYAAVQQQHQQQQQRPVPEARRRRGVSQKHDSTSNSSSNGWHSLGNQQKQGRALSSTLDQHSNTSDYSSPSESFLLPVSQQHRGGGVGYGNSGAGSRVRSTVGLPSDGGNSKPTDYETVTLDLPPKLPVRTPESYRVVSEDEDDFNDDNDDVVDTRGGGQLGQYESLRVQPTSPNRSLPTPPDTSIYATVNEVAPPPPPPQSAPPLPVSSAPTPSVSTSTSIANNVTAPFKELASKFKNLAPSSLTGALTADSQSKTMSTLAKYTSPNVGTIGTEQDMGFGNRYRRKPVGPRKQPEQWSSTKLL